MCERVAGIKYISAIEPQGAFYIFIDVSEVLGKKYKGETVEHLQRWQRYLSE
ncbi:MAG: hypothetical protein HDT39_09695 [Lachnospiraceae bacterium]|nr:hypothetical protein [Lachnospiraceae bacterium]